MKTKSILVVVLTLIIGFVLGMLVSAELRYNRLKPVRMYFSEDRFREGFYKAIQPNEQQKGKIDVILDKYARINSDIQNGFRKDLESNMVNFRKEIDLILTKDQIERLKKIDERRNNMVRGRMYHGNDSTGFRHDRLRQMRSRGQGNRPGNDTSKTTRY